MSDTHEPDLLAGDRNPVPERVLFEAADLGEPDAPAETRRRFETLMANLPGMVYRCRNDTQWTMEFVSEGCLELTGFTSADLVGNARVSYADLILPDDREMVWREVQAALARRERFRIVYRLLPAQGGERWVWEQGQGIFGRAGELLFLEGFITDISERVQAEQALRDRDERLRQAQKMEAIGELAGGIAHDFNNLLTAILGYCDLLVQGLAGSISPQYLADLKEIQKAAERAGELTGQILAFSRKQALQPEVLSVTDVVREVEPLLERTLGENVDLAFLLQPDLGLCEVDRAQLVSALINLALNARDALPHGGRLMVETADVELDRDYCSRHGDCAPGRYVMLSVSDNGCGMDEATQRRVFEPFFTTKSLGKGTGLGLATVYGFVRQSGGHIFVYSEPGCGSTFKIYLPRVDREATPSAPLLAHARGQAQPGETILVVEDEGALRALTRRVLEGQGYVVVTAANGWEALEALGSLERVDLLLTDVVLPGDIQGDGLAKKVLEARPGLPVLYMSGYTQNAIVHAGRLDEGVNYLAKPFTPAGLLASVRAVLDDAESLS
jgi:PAS domain S-box-containing protein